MFIKLPHKFKVNKEKIYICHYIILISILKYSLWQKLNWNTFG